MKILSGNSGETWINYCKLLLKEGTEYFDEDDKIIELLDVYITFHAFDPQDIFFKNITDPKIVELYTRKMETTEIVPELNASYGKRLYDQLGIDQVEWLVKRLRSKPETKAATISLLLPDDPGPRIPCLSLIDLKIRGGKLHLTGFFRSQNVTRSYGNFIAIHHLHKKIANSLNCELGDMKFIVTSAHIYKKDLPEAKRIINESIKYLQ